MQCALLLALTLARPEPAPEAFLPAPSLDLTVEAPIRTWDEGIPLGNGLMGGLLWGEGSTLRLSLDRGDLWDLRTPEIMEGEDWTWATVRELVAEGNQSEIGRLFDAPYGNPFPTKIGAGRLEIDLDPSQQLESFRLRLAEAEGEASLEGGDTVRCFYSSEEPVALIHIQGPAPRSMNMRTPAAVDQLGYPEARKGATADATWYVQETADDLTYAAYARSVAVEGGTLIGVTVATSEEGDDPLDVARDRVLDALRRGYQELLVPHRDWWAEFWSKSRVDVPEEHILKHYYLVRYFHGAASRMGAPPMPLQGVWTADAGGLPPWKGDYHHDLNTQMTYLAYLSAGHMDEGRAFLEFLWDLLPEFRRFARDFYETPGAAVPAVMTLDGKPLGGWTQYSLHPTNGAWLGWMFYRHWLYTGDSDFLAERAYPWASEIGESILALLEPDDEGVLKLPLSSSPEIHNNSLQAWLEPNSSYDRDCMKALFVGLSHMASELGDIGAAHRWSAAAEALGPRLTEPGNGPLMYAAGEESRSSHRHLSSTMAIHPFGLLSVDQGADEREIIEATNQRYDELGTSAWVGYSFSWMACLRARVGDAEAALRNLDLYTSAFILRNGFHVNGDQTRSGFSGFTYRPFTLEGNFLAAEAVHEMLLQSWPTRPGVDEPTIRIFPAMPWRWHDASFEDLRVMGGHRVSGRWESNGTTWFRIVAGADGEVRIRDNFGGRAITWSRDAVRREGEDFVVALEEGEAIEARLHGAEIPPPPADQAEPVVIASGSIRTNSLPLRIGADSQGQSRFVGDMAQVRVYDRALSAEEIASLARGEAPSGSLIALDAPPLTAGSYPAGGEASLEATEVGTVEVAPAEGIELPFAFRFTGEGFLEIEHRAALNCVEGVTMAAWIRRTGDPSDSVRIIDKSPVGAATGYMLDTHPGDSLRLVFRDPHLAFDANLPVGEWVHVAGMVDAESGLCALYINGELVAEG